MCAEWVTEGRLLVTPDTSIRALSRLVTDAQEVQFAEPLARLTMDALAEALRSRPDVELYVYVHHGIALDADLGFLAGFEHVQRLSLNVSGLAGVDGLERFRALRTLTLQGIAKRNVDVAALEHLSALERLALDRPVSGLEAIGRLEQLTEFESPATASALSSLRGHPSLRKLILTRGTHRDLTALETCPQLTDVELWQIKQLTATDLKPVGRIPQLDALALGAARNVTDLHWLGNENRVRFLSLEKAPALDSFAPCFMPLAGGVRGVGEQTRGSLLARAAPTAARGPRPRRRLSRRRDRNPARAHARSRTDSIATTRRPTEPQLARPALLRELVPNPRERLTRTRRRSASGRACLGVGGPSAGAGVMPFHNTVTMTAGACRLPRSRTRRHGLLAVCAIRCASWWSPVACFGVGWPVRAVVA